MRIANKTIYDSIIRNLNKSTTDMHNAQEIVTTNKRINRLSDDPVGLVSVLDLRSSVAHIEQMERNISIGKSWLTPAESALRQADDILSKVKEVSVQMASATVGASERANSVDLIDGYLKQIINLANSQSGGRYIFGGTDTDTAPFALNSAETLVTYSGNDTPFSVRIGRNSSIEVGKDGEDVFGENWDNDNIFKTLIDLKSSLQNNDVAGIQDSITNLNTQMSHINSHISDIAGKTIRMEAREKIITDLGFTYTERMSQIEDADLPEAIIRLNSMELAYKASLASSSKIMELSLVDFV